MVVGVGAMGITGTVCAVEHCTSILPDGLCNKEEGQGIMDLLVIVLNILTGGVGVLATIGLVVSGIQYMTARDDAGKVAKAKSRIFNIVLGLLAYGVMWSALQWLIPGGLLNSDGSRAPDTSEEENTNRGGGAGRRPSDDSDIDEGGQSGGGGAGRNS